MTTLATMVTTSPTTINKLLFWQAYHFTGLKKTKGRDNFRVLCLCFIPSKLMPDYRQPYKFQNFSQPVEPAIMGYIIFPIISLFKSFFVSHCMMVPRFLWSWKYSPKYAVGNWIFKLLKAILVYLPETIFANIINMNRTNSHLSIPCSFNSFSSTESITSPTYSLSTNTWYSSYNKKC